MPLQQPLPQIYLSLSEGELTDRAARRKQELGSSLVILGHHYQRDAVVELADFVGDSLKLSQIAATQRSARYIVFCGVHFMAESADILASPDQCVLLPHMMATCSMAEMAEDAALEAALEELSDLTDARIVPITYVNSTAAAKAITARAGGACCTSSNVRNVFDWALTPAAKGGGGADKVFAVPDQNLGRNTAVAMGYNLEDCVVYDQSLPNGGLTKSQIDAARFVLWKGHCYVHARFTPEHVRQVRDKHPGIRVIVHPECPCEVVQLADASGSTEQIIQAVDSGPRDQAWAIGTESNLVRRLAKRRPGQVIRELSDTPSLCRQMGRIDLPHLLWVLDELAEGRVVNRVSVDKATAADARVALERMIGIKAVTGVTSSRQ